MLDDGKSELQIPETELIEPSQEALVKRLSHGKNQKYVRFLIAALEVAFLGLVVSSLHRPA